MADQKQILTIKDILDFCWCPRYYDLKKNDPNHNNLKDLYNDALHKCFYEYLLALQNNTLANRLETLKYRWGKEWIKQKKNSQTLCTPSATKRDTYDAKRRAGIDAIITFDKLMDTSQYPILINKQYSLPITDNITLIGTWEYIREVEINDNKTFQLLKFKTENNRFNVACNMNHDIELSAAAIAFLKAFNVNSVQIVYVDIYKKKLVSSYRTQKDYDLFKQTVISVAHCIKHNIRCVSPDKRCYHCEYRDVCTSKL